ncbi:NADH:flavin oxidoreductase [Amycolatopsis thermophila]|uniref:2,4-dienoyl-CoA reductase-like NADH-dependent reductase (Old Yellow Enzyme family) n=1 Tax=Amycolatopsis thermophila TaxID=206084 RepID=A0ABU0ELV1_9PSEU|nr:NADH:flavin oxidoreductase [Amycolatopsis thermophila]MDQ0376265.1 2,4-dienoyl-CoA reductase-like NADH-dependent reductase (Old Yellow Enzyme family) [Amycolatopsis thermophila]
MTDPLLTPFRLKTLTLRNRVVSTSHEPGYGVHGMPADRYRAYHVEKARGGIALTMIGGGAVVSPDATPSFANLRMDSDDVVPWLRRLSDEVHAEGAAVMTQLTHLGHRTSNHSGDWLPVLSVSAVREPAHRAFTREAEPHDLRRIAADFASAALRCQDGGLDGVELMAYGHLLDSFWSPAMNRRTDGYGGDLDARMRFPLEVIAAVREAVGSDFVVGIRMAVEERRPGGLTAEEGLEIARRVVDAGIDFISVIRGHISTENGLSHVIPPMGERSAPHLTLAGAVRAHVGVPVMHAARIADLATARYAIAEGLLDLVGMTRAHLADPHLVRKLQAGEADRIRPCVGASACIDAAYLGEPAHCVHNASTGRELQLPHRIPPAPAVKRAVVVGAGVAGLEAARVLAERGHDVTVFEAADQPGGQLLLAAKTPRRRDLAGIVDWRVAELRRLGVAVKLNHYAEAREVLELEPDVVVVATGGTPDTRFLDAGANLVHDTWDVLSGAVRPSGSVLVYDDHGGHPGLDAVDALLDAGADVEWVSPERTIGVEVGSVNAPPYLRRFTGDGVRVTLLHRLTRVERDGSRLRAVFTSDLADTGAETLTRVVDHVVVEHGTLPNADLYHDLVPHSTNLGEITVAELLARREQPAGPNADGAFRLYRIGDAVSSRSIHSAVLDAFRLCVAV